jgi:hypothetical protein
MIRMHELLLNGGTDLAFHPKLPLNSLFGLAHFGSAFTLRVLGGRRRRDLGKRHLSAVAASTLFDASFDRSSQRGRRIDWGSNYLCIGTLTPNLSVLGGMAESNAAPRPGARYSGKPPRQASYERADTARLQMRGTPQASIPAFTAGDALQYLRADQVADNQGCDNAKQRTRQWCKAQHRGQRAKRRSDGHHKRRK